jgi:hypothetical protein
LTGKCSLSALFVCLCASAATAQPPAHLNDQHLLRPDIPLRFLGAPGHALESLRMMNAGRIRSGTRKGGQRRGIGRNASLCCLPSRTIRRTGRRAGTHVVRKRRRSRESGCDGRSRDDLRQRSWRT